MLGAVPEPLDPGGLVILAAVENARDDHASAEIQRTALQPESFEAVVDIRPFQPAQSAGLDAALIVILVRIVTHPVEGATEFGDRKSVVSGKSVSVRVDLGGHSVSKNKHKLVVCRV